MKNKKIFEDVIHGIFLLLGLVTVACVLLITVYLVIAGIPAIREIGLVKFLFGKEWASTAAEPKYGILPFAAILGLIVGLLVLEPHFSASIIIIAVGGVMMFLGGVRLGWFIGAGSAAAVGIGVLLMLFPYASGRINTWRDPFSSSSDEGYQIVQSLYTIGSGGLSGLGLGMSRQKYLYLPEEHNDFIFSVVCEELGFIGAALILLLFALLILRGYWIALHCRDRFSFLVVAGITTLLAIQVFLNVAVVTNLVPCTGISLPFFSYGGTALLIQLGEMGIILSASRDVIEK